MAVSINFATELQLKELPGIGEIRAARLIEFRHSRGAITRDNFAEILGINPSTALLAQIDFRETSRPLQLSHVDSDSGSKGERTLSGAYGYDVDQEQVPVDFLGWPTIFSKFACYRGVKRSFYEVKGYSWILCEFRVQERVYTVGWVGVWICGSVAVDIF